jgi:TonB-linked SusC/RagA family outer membrane protein
MTKSLTKLLRIASMLCMSMLLYHQVNAQVKVSGKVISETSEALPGVSVVVKGTTEGTTTDASGAFNLELRDADATLIFSFVGYTTQEVSVGNRTTIDIQMQPDISTLEEVVVIGYGTQKAGSVTGAIASVKSEDFLVGKVQDATELIKGKIAGLVITKSSGDPNATSTIRLRGITTIEGNISPLVLVNGVPADLTSVAPDNIESIDVLKDGSAAAIYGTRGANGVILITTKSGKRDRPVSVNYTGYGSVADFYKQAEFMGPSDIRRAKTAFGDDGYDTDWVKAVTRTGYQHNHSLTIDGGTKNSAYSGNFSYRYEAGTIKKSDNDQYRLQLNLDQYLFDDIVKINFNILKDYRINTANNASNGDLTNIYRQAVIRNPTSPIYDETTGEYAEEFNRYQYFNPVSMLNELVGENESETTNLIGNITIEPINRWKTNLMVSNNLFNANFSSYATSKYYTSITTGIPGNAYKSFNAGKQKVLELTTSYDLTAGDHSASIMAGYSYNYWVYSGFDAGNRNFSTDSYLYNNMFVGGHLKDGDAYIGSYKNDALLIAFFGRLQYAFRNKYNLMASVRQEGSSKFGDNHKWGLFPAISAGWTISEENFLQDVVWIDNLKLRGGYGVTGRVPGGSYQSMLLYNSNENFLNKDGDWVAAYNVAQNPNPDLKWETTAEVNVGLDFQLFSRRLKGSFDVYSKKTEDLLYQYTVPVPPNLAQTTAANVGSLSNKGFEIMLTGSPVSRKNFEWNTTVTLSHNENKLLKLSNELYETNDYMYGYSIGDPISVPSHRWKEGESVGNFWGLKSVGVTEDGLWLIENPATGEAIPYSTSLNSDTYRQDLGNGYAQVFLGWNNSFRYKNFDLNIQLTGQFGFKILNQQRMFYENNSIQYNRLKSAADPVYGQRPLATSQAQAFVSYYLEDGDYVKFDNVTLGYNMDASKLSKYFSKARLYMSGQNFWIITNYSGLDPELANANFVTPGSDFRDKYPTIRSFTVGLNVTFN